MSKILVVSLLLVTFVLGMGFGYFFSPYYSPSAQSLDMSSHFGSADRWVDLRYINQMIAHHRGAILMAENMENKTERQEIKDLIAEIQTNEPKLIDNLYKYKQTFYNDFSLVKDPNVATFGQKDNTADLRFLNALIGHHEEGIKMTKEIRLKSSKSEIIDDADKVEKFLSETKIVLNQWRQSWYNL